MSNCLRGGNYFETQGAAAPFCVRGGVCETRRTHETAPFDYGTESGAEGLSHRDASGASYERDVYNMMMITQACQNKKKKSKNSIWGEVSGYFCVVTRTVELGTIFLETIQIKLRFVNLTFHNMSRQHEMGPRTPSPAAGRFSGTRVNDVEHAAHAHKLRHETIRVSQLNAIVAGVLRKAQLRGGATCSFVGVMASTAAGGS